MRRADTTGYCCKCTAVLPHVIFAREESLHYILRVFCSTYQRGGRDDNAGELQLSGCSQARSAVQWEEPRTVPGRQVQPPKRSVRQQEEPPPTSGRSDETPGVNKARVDPRTRNDGFQQYEGRALQRTSLCHGRLCPDDRQAIRGGRRGTTRRWHGGMESP